MYSKVFISRHLSDNYSIQNCLKQGNALSPLLFKFAVEYGIKKFQEIQVRLKLDQLLVYANEVNVLGDNIDTMHKSAENLIGASKEVGLEVNAEKTKYMLLSCQPNAGQNCDIKKANGLFENVLHFKYLGMAVTSQHFI
jgi:hypothetical protein